MREAASRVIGQRHFDVQLMGGGALHLGNIAEMKTGEGKTLTAVLPSYLNALTGRGVHVVTVNDYLARYHAEWMGRVHRFLGLEVGVILADMDPEVRRKQYAADVTYGTNNEFGFDYLRDNMAWGLEECVQRGHYFAIVDEVDSILIDEARTPLIISGPVDQNSIWYQEFAKIAPRLRRGEDGEGDYEVDEKKRTVGILESGVQKVEDWLGIDNLYESVNTPLISFLNNSIKAKELYTKDKDYVVMNGEVLIVDEFTGRILAGRRWSEGMHQAVEAKEGVQIKDENQTLATITLQNYFRLYEKLSGMTGTALTEANEFHQTYKLGVVPIPTNMPMIRVDQPDLVYQTEDAKWDALVEDIVDRHHADQPVLVGTTSVEKSELVSRRLKQQGHPARGAEREVPRARGRDRRAGRAQGRDHRRDEHGRARYRHHARREPGVHRGPGAAPARPVPGGHPGGLRGGLARARWRRPQGRRGGARGGRRGWRPLRARHRAARVAPDRQPAARPLRPSGRPGRVAVLPLARGRADGQVQRRQDRAPDAAAQDAGGHAAGVQAGQPRDQVGPGQRRVAQLRDPQGRAQVRRCDEPPAQGRLRRAAGRTGGRRPARADQRHDRRGRDEYVAGATADGFPEEWDLEKLWRALRQLYPVHVTIDQVTDDAGGERSHLTREILTEEIREDAHGAYVRREEELTPDVMREFERRVVLSVLDRKWREHLYEMDYLREGVSLRGYGQRDPLIEYQREGYDMFTTMMEGIREESVTSLFNLQVQVQAEPDRTKRQPRTARCRRPRWRRRARRSRQAAQGRARRRREARGASAAPAADDGERASSGRARPRRGPAEAAGQLSYSAPAEDASGHGGAQDD